jgi:hypothetical protein
MGKDDGVLQEEFKDLMVQLRFFVGSGPPLEVGARIHTFVPF